MPAALLPVQLFADAAGDMADDVSRAWATDLGDTDGLLSSWIAPGSALARAS